LNDALYIVVIIGLAATAIALRVVAGRLDRSRIRKEIARSGGDVLGITSLALASCHNVRCGEAEAVTD
jgi:hypothetical protein